MSFQADGTTLMDNAHENYLTSAEKAKNKYLAYVLLVKSDNVQYGKLKEDLQNSHARGQNKYPETVAKAHHLLSTYKEYKRHHAARNNNYGVSFAQNGGKKNDNNNPHKDLECYKCGEKGHIKTNCPKKNINC